MSPHIIDEALDLLCANYIFPEKAATAADAIRRRRAAGEYDGLDEETLAARLTADLAEVCADKHLRVRTREAALHDARTRHELEAAYREGLRHANYGIARVERLDGNVGYLDLRQIAEASVGGRAIAAAMELIVHTEALIIDLRRNRGGAPNGVTFWLSYLFRDDETHLNDIYDGPSGRTRQFWTLAHLPGERYPDRPVFVLTSDTTFSAGEEFCYNLQALGRASRSRGSRARTGSVAATALDDELRQLPASANRSLSRIAQATLVRLLGRDQWSRAYAQRGNPTTPSRACVSSAGSRR